MTWNLWWRFGDWEARAAAIERVVREQDPDLLLLQEVWSEPEDPAATARPGDAPGDVPLDSLAHRLGRALGRHVALTDDPFAEHRAARRAAGEEAAGFHNAILSRWPLLDVASHPLPRLDGEPGHRRALTAVVDAPSGRWPVVSTHLDYRFDESLVRQRQCEALLRIVAAVRADPATTPPVIVGGDFNAVPDSDEIRLLTGRRAGPLPGLVLSDCWEQVGEGPGPTWRRDNPYQAATAWPERRLDYVFVSWPRPKPAGNPVRAWLAGHEPVDGLHPSDHAAVVVDLVDELPAGEDPGADLPGA